MIPHDPIEKGRANGVYQDFLTGFTTGGKAWGRPVGVAVASDGSLLVTDDGAKVIWRVSYVARALVPAAPGLIPALAH